MNKKTIDFFHEINQIPRESGNEQGICDYLVNFAHDRNLEYQKDSFHNVLIKKKTCEKEPLILQVHTDMVCEKETSLQFDFEYDPIQTIEEDGYLKTLGTTLGADNGIGVAQILSILDRDIPCNIEAVFTSEEETSMNGAMNFDTTQLKGTKMINLDGFEENTIIIESSCFYDTLIHLSYHFDQPNKPNCFKLSLYGLLGGHSGFDIDKDRGNASILLAELLANIPHIELASFIGGTKFNVIPSSSVCTFFTDLSETELKELCQSFIDGVSHQYLDIDVTITKENETTCINEKDSIHFIHSIHNFKHGVFYAHDGNPTTSINLGVVDLKQNIMKVGMRSSRHIEELACLDWIHEYAEEENYVVEIIGSQPGFQSLKDSPLISVLKETGKIGNQEPILKSVHITVETGFFKQKMKNLDVAIISPNIKYAHTPKECVELESIVRVDLWLERFLKQY